MTKLNFGIIGLGNMGLLHLLNCLKNVDVDVIAAADISKKAQSKARSLGVKTIYSGYENLFEKTQDLDAVVISLPNFLHLESVRLASESGVDILIEKPLARNLEESREIVKLCDKTGQKLMIAHSMRYIDCVDKIKKKSEDGHIGSLEIVTIENIQNGPFSHGRIPRPVSKWWFDPEKSGGGALLDVGYHLIDLFHFFSGYSEVLFSYLDYKLNLPVEDGATLILKSREYSTRGIINLGWFERTVFPRFNFRLILHGNSDYISTDDYIPGNIYFHAIKEGAKNSLRRLLGRKVRPLSYTYYWESYYKEMEDFVNCIKNDSDFPVKAFDGLKTMEIIDEAYKLYEGSMEEGK